MSGLLQIKVNVVKALQLKDIGLSDAQIRRVNRKAANDYLKFLDKTIPTRIATKNDIGVTGFRKYRTRRKRALAKSRSPRASYWVGENDVLAQFKKGAWRDSQKGAAKGSFFKDNAFIIKFKNGKKMMLIREDGKIKPVRVPLVGYEAIVASAVNSANNEISRSFQRDISIELGKKK